MASMMDKLRAMLGMKRTEQVPENNAASVQRSSEFQALSRQFLECEDEELKAQLWKKMCKALPDTLFLASVCYREDKPSVPVRDRNLHATVGARRLYPFNQQVLKGNPGYRLGEKDEKRRLHLRTVVYQKTKEEWVALFTDFEKLLPVFGQTTRVAMISFNEARLVARNYKGIMINPGKDAIRLDNSEIKKVI